MHRSIPRIGPRWSGTARCRHTTRPGSTAPAGTTRETGPPPPNGWWRANRRADQPPPTQTRRCTPTRPERPARPPPAMPPPPEPQPGHRVEPGDDHRVRRPQRRKPEGHINAEAGRGRHQSGTGRTHLKGVSVTFVGMAKDLGCDRQIESNDSGDGQHDHPVQVGLRGPVCPTAFGHTVPRTNRQPTRPTAFSRWPPSGNPPVASVPLPRKTIQRSARSRGSCAVVVSCLIFAGLINPASRRRFPPDPAAGDR